MQPIPDYALSVAAQLNAQAESGAQCEAKRPATKSSAQKLDRILSELNAKGKTRVPRVWLSRANFDFTLFTSIYTTKAGKVYYFVYDQGYLGLGNELFLLIRKGADC